MINMNVIFITNEDLIYKVFCRIINSLLIWMSYLLAMRVILTDTSAAFREIKKKKLP